VRVGCVSLINKKEKIKICWIIPLIHDNLHHFRKNVSTVDTFQQAQITCRMSIAKSKQTSNQYLPISVWILQARSVWWCLLFSEQLSIKNDWNSSKQRWNRSGFLTTGTGLSRSDRTNCQTNRPVNDRSAGLKFIPEPLSSLDNDKWCREIETKAFYILSGRYS